jgi:hypothetical protein
MTEAAKELVFDLLTDGYTVTKLKYSNKMLMFHFDVSETKGLTDLRKAGLLWLLDNGQIMSVDINEQELVMSFFHPTFKKLIK